jgi:beta-lactamase regulating signal transducer with metallopeptidase domain
MTLIISLLAKGSILLFAAAALQAIFGRRASAAMRHLVWTLAIVGLLALPLLSVALPGWTAVRMRTPGGYGATPPVVASPLEPTRTRAAGDAAAPTPVEPVAFEAAGASSDEARWFEGFAPWLPAVYAGVALLLVCRLGGELVAVRRLARRSASVDDPDWTRLLKECADHLGIRRPVELLRSVETAMPMALRARYDAILIPAIANTWPDDLRRAVLVHELAHIARRDCLTQMLAAVACAAYWPHPAVWLVARRLRVEREMACDDCVLSAGASARHYATHLLELAYSVSGTRAPAVAVAMAGRRQIETRLLAILDAARNRTTPAVRSRVACAAILAAVLVPLATASTGQQPQEAGRGPVENEAAAVEVPEVAPAAAPPEQAAPAAVRAPLGDPVPGIWQIRRSARRGIVRITLSEGDSSNSSDVDVQETLGLTPAELAGGFGPVYFTLQREAGTFAFEGFVRDGVGAGTYTFRPSPAFAAELAGRGVQGLTPAGQRILAREDIGTEFLDELKAQGYATPSVGDLVRMAQHGAGLSYLREMAALGYRLPSVDLLVRLRDHGVTPEYVRDLAELGFTGLAADDLVRARDHGVDPEYVEQLAQLGITPGSLDRLIRARDHGVDPPFVRELRDLGYGPDLDELQRMRDHGVDPEYVRGLSNLGFRRLSIDALIDARDRGIDLEYIRGMRALGYTLSVDELKRARDHGIDTDYVRGMSALGYQRLSIETLIRLRDNGVDPAFVRNLQALGYGNVGLDELVRLRRLGVTH